MCLTCGARARSVEIMEIFCTRHERSAEYSGLIIVGVVKIDGGAERSGESTPQARSWAREVDLKSGRSVAR